MNAILLASGYGKRLRPYTRFTPKCLIKVKGVPLLKIWLNQLERANIKKVLINTHYLSEKIENFLKKNEFRIKIELSYEKKLLGTAGTLIKNINFYENRTGLLIHADNYCQEPILNVIRKHKQRPRDAIMTALTFSTNDISSCGIFKVDKKNLVLDFFEKPKGNYKNIGNIANGAIYVLSENFFNIARKKFTKAKNFSEDIIPKIKHKIYCYHVKKKLIDIGSIKNYNKVK